MFNNDKFIKKSKCFLENKTIYYFEFEYHRFSLLAWYDDLLRNNKPSAVITIDRHRDLVKPDNNKLKQFLNFNNEFELNNLTLNLPSYKNDDFIVYALFNNFCSDILIISYENYHEIELQNMIKSPFYDKNSNAHQFICIPSLIELLNIKNTLTYKAFYENLINNKNVNIILDIDLDYFTYQSPDDGVFIRDKYDIENSLNLIKPIFNEIIPKVTTISIARESNCCGGIVNAMNIKNYIFNFLFDLGIKF